ncbi:MAG TPA: DUF2520 domain-containing protein [Candidatus Limnocylindrales bacterium]|jgi:predicted short-subunit dehydrogenase-like oxidoreductase (DUF2520 family)|nr:DUF2520 domain-containing protein [Candidatus Limnocylindrales bacterium]
MIQSVHVVGSGRAGRTLAARLLDVGLDVREGRRVADVDLVLLCVPDTAIAEVASGIPVGPWVAHVSGATRLSALDPHRRRFSVHPLQTLTLSRGPEQLDGAWAAISADTSDGLAHARWLVARLGLHHFELADEDRTLYHAAAVIGGNFVVTLHAVATRLLAAAGAPPEAIVPLMRRTIENEFELTGPIARGDWTTVDAHIAALEERAPDVVALYRALAEATRR